MSVFYNYVKNSIWKVSKGLIRDFRELELMQTGSSLTLERFVSRSISRSRELILNELKALNYKSIIFEGDQLPAEDGLYIIINPLEGINNLKRSLPFFAVTAVQLKIQNGVKTPLALVICFPAFADIIYTESGQGAWLERYDDSRKGGSRLRSSGESDLDKCNVNYDFAKFEKKIRSFRHFGSENYDLCLFASGKFDAIYIKKESVCSSLASQLIAKETGAYFKVLESGDIILVNSNLATYYKK